MGFVEEIGLCRYFIGKHVSQHLYKHRQKLEKSYIIATELILQLIRDKYAKLNLKVNLIFHILLNFVKSKVHYMLNLKAQLY